MYTTKHNNDDDDDDDDTKAIMTETGKCLRRTRSGMFEHEGLPNYNHQDDDDDDDDGHFLFNLCSN